MSALPSPLKSLTRTLIQVADVLQVSQSVEMNAEPLERSVHHWPPSSQRPVMSALPSPLKSPTRTSTQVTPVLQMSHRLVLKAVEPLDRPTYHWPFSKARPAMSNFPSPLKSPTFSSTQVPPVRQPAH